MMNKFGLSSNFVCMKKSRPLVLFGFEDQKSGPLLENKVHQSYENMSKINVLCLEVEIPFELFYVCLGVDFVGRP